MTMKRTVQALCGLILFCGAAIAQSVTSNLVGTVFDPTGASVPDAEIQVKNEATGALRTASSSADGVFRITNLPPGIYSLTIKVSGFKTYAQSALNLASQETRDLGRIQLAVGSVADEVTVTAAATPVQTASSEKSSLVDGDQLNRLAIKGRDFMAMLNLIPGMVSAGAGETTSVNSINSVNANGAVSGRHNFTVDGITDLDTGGDWTLHYQPNMDSISEIRVLTANYQAEYGRMSGAQISVITRNGSQRFHGAAWATKRHEMWNAKSWFNNFNNQQKPIYRYFIGGFRVDGPVYIPGVFNRSKTKLFFMVSQEYTRQKPTTTTGYAWVPTAAERRGDFSGVIDNGTKRMRVMYDPTNRNILTAPQQANMGQFITSPASAAWGKAMMNYFPLPNECSWSNNAPGCWTDTDFAAGYTQNYTRNYRYSFTGTHPRRNDVVRLDGNLTGKLTAWWRYVNDYDFQETNPGIPLFSTTVEKGCASVAAADRTAHLECWKPFTEDRPNPGRGHGIGLTYTISPTAVNELTLGYSYNTWDYYPHDVSQMDRNLMNNPPHWFDEKSGGFATDGNLTRPTLSPGAQNFAFWVPAISSASVANPGTNHPYTNWNHSYTLSDNFSKVHGKHSFKAGIYVEHTDKTEQASVGSYLGNYTFSGGPMDANYGNANLFLGNFGSYSEGGRSIGDFRFTGVEAFLQDNWRVTRRLTLDLGIRFYDIQPQVNVNDNSAVWLPSAYNPAKAARLYVNGCTVAVPAVGQCPTANQVALDQLTGATTYSSLVGTFVPGSGDYFNGTVVVGKSNLVPRSMFTQPRFKPAPRFGFAWDVFGNGRTAIRGGWGQSFQRGGGSVGILYGGQPPVNYNRVVYYTNVAAVPAAANSAGVSPIASSGLSGKQDYEETISTSFGIQQNVGFGTVVDASYVGSFRRHTLQQRSMNPIPIYSAYDPKNASPWSPANPKRAWSSNFYRPLPGLGDVSMRDFSGSTDYNSLQVSVRRAMRRGLSYGLAYTHGKSMMSTPYSTTYVTQNPYWPDKFRNWGPNYAGAPDVVSFNYVYDIPGLGKRLNRKWLAWIADDWTLSGITQIWGRQKIAIPAVAGFSGATNTNPAPDFTGSAEGARMIVLRNPSVPAGDVRFDMSDWTKTNTFDWQALMTPMPCSWTPMARPQDGIGRSLDCFGNAGAGSLLSMPTRMNNWDVNIAKAFRVKERYKLTFRAEMYNVFNHTQFTGYNTTIQLDLPSWQNGIVKQTNTSLGRPTGVRDSRKMAMTLRLEF